MKGKKLQELRSKKIQELKVLIYEAEKELVKLRMEKASGKLKDISALRQKRKEIAVIKTLIKEKQ